MSPVRIFKLSFRTWMLVLIGLFASPPEPAAANPQVGGTIVNCLAKRVRGAKLCIVKAPHLRQGGEVVVYTPRGYWVASGHLWRVRGHYAMGIFPRGAAEILPGYLASTLSADDQAMEWSQAFSR